MADESHAVQDDDGFGSGLFGEPKEAEVASGEPEKDEEAEEEQVEEAEAEVDEETLKIQEFIGKYKAEDGGINLEKLAKEAMHAQRLIGQKGQEIGQLKKKAEDLDSLMGYVNSNPKALKAWNKLLAGDLDEGGEKPAVISSEDLDKRLIEDMRAGKISSSIKSVVEDYLKSNGLFDEVRTVKKTLETTRAEQAKQSRDAAACAFLAEMERDGWTKKVGKAHYFVDADLDSKWVELYNQGYGPEDAFHVAKGRLNIVDLPKKPSAKKKAAMMGTGSTKTAKKAAESESYGEDWDLLKQGFEEAYGSDITQSRT